MKCPSCGTESEGSFCPKCGAALYKAKCAHCGKPIRPGTRFCGNCGKPVAASDRGERTHVAWYVAGAALALLVVVLAVQLVREPRPPTPTPIGLPAPGSPGALEGTLREQADRLFDRVMRMHAAGDTAQARFFMPMALEAYEGSRPLDDDGLYHLAVLHTAAGNYERGRATADEILANNADHLLGLAVAAEATALAGDTAAARAYYQRLLEAYPTESTRPLPEYEDHAAILPEYRAAAERFMGR